MFLSCLNNGFEFLHFLALVINCSLNWIWYLIYIHLTIGEFNWLCVLCIFIKIGSKLNSFITSICIDWSCCTYCTFDGTYQIYTWTLAIVGYNATFIGNYVQNWFNIKNTYLFGPQHKALGKLGPYLDAMSINIFKQQIG